MPNPEIDWLSDALLRVVEERELADLATVVSAGPASGLAPGTKLLVYPDGRVEGTMGDAELDRLVAVDGQSATAERKSRMATYRAPGADAEAQVEVFHEVLEPQPQLLVVGAGHIAVPLAHFGKLLGFEVVVIDDRDKYASVERFPDADKVIPAEFGPTLKDFHITRATYVVIITRAHTYDEEALRIILDRPWAYLGMIGSRRRVQTVVRALAGEGYDTGRLSEIRAPIGLDIGSETPEEIALAIIAEVVAARRGGSGLPLSQMIRPIAV